MSKKMVGNYAEEKLQAMIAWAEDHSEFDSSFIESVYEKYKRYGHLSEFQDDALDNIIQKWKMDLEDYGFNSR